MTNLREKAFGYIRTNWGAPFVLAFIVLLIASAALLSAGQSTTANNLAVYAFYALVLGVALQIASYIKYGENEPNESLSYMPPSWAPPRSWRPGKKTLAVVIVVIVLIAGIGLAMYYETSIVHTTHANGHLSAGLNFIATTPGPNNSVLLTIGINETGGIEPLSFTAYWGDGINQSNAVGVFIRAFLQNQTIPSTMKVVVDSSDGQNATVLVTIPYVNRTITTISTTSTITTSSVTQKTTSSSTTTTPSISFVETGLPSGTLWAITLSGQTGTSSTNQIVFNIPPGTYSFTVSEPYDSQNFSRAFVTSPLTGTVSLNKASVQETVTYSTIVVNTPTNQLFHLVSEQNASFVNGTLEFNVTYTNSFPVQVHAIAIAIIRSNSTGLIAAEAQAPIEPQGSGEQSSILLASGLAPGKYNVSLFVQTSYGVDVSETSNFTIAIT